jgi:hypothetical protein
VEFDTVDVRWDGIDVDWDGGVCGVGKWLDNKKCPSRRWIEADKGQGGVSKGLNKGN